MTLKPVGPQGKEMLGKNEKEINIRERLIADFANEMEKKFKEFDNKKSGWAFCNMEYAIDKIDNVTKKITPFDASERFLDIANYAFIGYLATKK